jgi:hypothetical protein
MTLNQKCEHKHGWLEKIEPCIKTGEILFVCTHCGATLKKLSNGEFRVIAPLAGINASKLQKSGY